MIRFAGITAEVGLFRLYPGQSDDPFATYQAVCSVRLDQVDKSAFLYGMCGEVTLVHLVGMAEWFVQAGFTRVFAERARDKRLPGFTRLGDGHQSTDPVRWLKRFKA